MKRYDEDFKKKMIRLHLEEGRSKKSLEEEYNIGNGTIGNWIKEYNKECLAIPEKQAEKDYFAKTLKLEKENEELKKEVVFLKKAAAFFAKENE